MNSLLLLPTVLCLCFAQFQNKSLFLCHWLQSHLRADKPIKQLLRCLLQLQVIPLTVSLRIFFWFFIKEDVFSIRDEQSPLSAFNP